MRHCCWRTGSSCATRAGSSPRTTSTCPARAAGPPLWSNASACSPTWEWMLKQLLSLLAAIIFTTGCSATAQDTPAGEVVLKVGDQKGNAKTLLTAAGLLNDFPYKIEWATFTSGPPLLEAASAGAIDLGGVGTTPPI